MNVSGLTGILHNATDALNGSTGAASVLAVLNGNCFAVTPSAGTYSFDFKAYQIGGWDRADVYALGADGQYTYKSVYAFSAELDLTSLNVTGYTSSAGASVSANLYDGTTLLGTASTAADAGGAYDLSIVSMAGMLSPGRLLSLASSDGETSSISIPNLTINLDKPNNLISGSAPVGKTLSAQLWNASASQSVTVAENADNSGNYSISFDGVLYPDCITPAKVGDNCTRGSITFVQPDGQKVEAWAAVIPPDAYESDGIWQNARDYTGVMNHTLDSSADQDWIKITVSPEMLNHPLNLATINLGVGNVTALTLYKLASGNVVALANSTQNSQGGSSLVWTFTDSGTYYVEITAGAGAYLTCQTAQYSFIVFTQSVYLPHVLR
jgi:hypothetical protein